MSAQTSLLKKIRWIAWAAAIAMTVVAASTWFGAIPLGERDGKPLSPVPGIGGPFTMTDHAGKAFTEANLGGRPSLMFFGFTSCPDICPTTLTNISSWLAELSAAADGINPIFVTVDPERDTADVLANYLTSFDKRIVGLTGTPEQLAAMAKAYRFYYAKVQGQGGDYTLDHTASVYLLDRQARFVGTIDYHEAPGNAAAKLRRLLKL